MSKYYQTESPSIGKNLLGGLIFLLGLLVAIRVLLLIVTQHYHTVTVPDFKGCTVDASRLVGQKSGVNLIVQDSVYVNSVAKGTVFSQNPSAGTKVKKGRTVYLILNASRDKEVTVPDVCGYSLRQAVVELMSHGFAVGELMYVRDIATDNVLEQSQPAGCRVKAGTVVDLTLGLNSEDVYVAVPNVIGQLGKVAVNNLKTNSLNVRVFYDGTVATENDARDAFVYMQNPSETDVSVVRGKTVSVYLTLDPRKLPVFETEEIEDEQSDIF